MNGKNTIFATFLASFWKKAQNLSFLAVIV